jgi:hypothetical protein
MSKTRALEDFEGNFGIRVRSEIHKHSNCRTIVLGFVNGSSSRLELRVTASAGVPRVDEVLFCSRQDSLHTYDQKITD